MVLEKEFQKLVIDLAHIHGWLVAHFRTALNVRGQWMTPVQADGAGFPDLCMVRAERMIFAELKRKGGKLSEKQELWRAKIRYVPHVEHYVWSEDDLPHIEETLA